MKYKYRFTIKYQTERCRDVSEFMRCCDLDIGNIYLKEDYYFKSDRDIPIGQFKSFLTKGFESLNHNIIDIEGGKIE
jgi:hypothetical protein